MSRVRWTGADAVSAVLHPVARKATTADRASASPAASLRSNGGGVPWLIGERRNQTLYDGFLGRQEKQAGPPGMISERTRVAI